MAFEYDGNGLCGIDFNKPDLATLERDAMLMVRQFKQAVGAWGTNLLADSRGEHDCQGRHLSRFAVSTGAPNEYALLVNLPSIKVINGGYYTGLWFTFKAGFTNTGPATLNVTPQGGAALGPKAIKLNGASLSAGTIPQGSLVYVVYNGSEFELLSVSGGAGGGGGAVVTEVGQDGVSNTIPLIDIPAFQLPMGANERWGFHAFFHLTFASGSPSSALKLSFSGPASPLFYFASFQYGTGSQLILTAYNQLALSPVFASTNSLVIVAGAIQTLANGGTLQLRGGMTVLTDKTFFLDGYIVGFRA